MWPIKGKWGFFVLSFVLASALFTGCSNGEDEAAKAKDEAAQADNTKTDEQAADANPVPVVNVDLGMDPKAVVAEYEGGKVTVKDFENYLEIQAFLNPQAGLAINEKSPEALKMFVDTYVAEAVMAERAKDTKDAETEAKRLVDQIKGQYLMVFGGDEKKLEKHMEDQGVTNDDLTQFFIRYKKVESYLRSGVSDAEVQKKYDEGKKNNEYVTASVRHILISAGDAAGAPVEEGKKPRTDAEAKKLADDIANRLRKGEDFAKLAKEFSDDPGSKENGGLYKDADVSQWVPEFKKAAVELPLNQISDPVKTDFGYHVMKVEDRHEKSFDEVKDLIRSQFINQKYDEFLSQELKGIVKKVNLPENQKK